MKCPEQYAFQSTFFGTNSPWSLSKFPISSCEVSSQPFRRIRWSPKCSMSPYLEKLVQRESLSRADTQKAIDYAVSGEANDIEIGAFLSLLSAKGETSEEVSGIVASMHDHMVPIHGARNVLDIVGTGGDGANTVNISTAASIVAAAAGCRVAKHGNRSVSSKSGSADVLEELGIELSLGPKGVLNCIDTTGIGFMFAPQFHPAMKYVRPARQAMKIRTVFNIIGPLINPCQANHAVIGVYSPTLLDTMADVLLATGVNRAVVVHTEGLDEFSNTGVSQVIEVKDGRKQSYLFDPQTELGMAKVKISDLRGGDAQYNADIIRKVLSGELEGPITDAIALNAGVGCYVYGIADSLRDGVEQAKQVLRTGQPMRTLEKWAVVSQESINL